MSEVTKLVDENQHVTPVPTEGAALVSMIERMASNPNVDIEKFERLVAMKERFELQSAQRAYNDAIASAKGEIGIVYKNKTVDFSSQKGRTHYQHEDFSSVARAVDPVLSKYGLSYRFRSTQDGTSLIVTCIVSHRDGYSEETTLRAAEDHSGNKNNIQAIGSAATYLQRYTLKLALGLASSSDDDGQRAGAGPTISSDQIATLLSKFDEVSADVKRFCDHFKIDTYASLPAARFDEAIRLLNAKARANG